MNDLPVIGPYIDIGGWIAVIALVLVSMIRGWLVASSQIQKIIDAYERIIAQQEREINNWKVAFNNSDARGDILAENQRVLLESVKVTNDMIQNIAIQLPQKRETIT